MNAQRTYIVYNIADGKPMAQISEDLVWRVAEQLIDGASRTDVARWLKICGHSLSYIREAESLVANKLEWPKGHPLAEDTEGGS